MSMRRWQGDKVAKQLSLVVNYDAVDSVIARLLRRGATISRCHTVIVGKRARIFYYIRGG